MSTLHSSVVQIMSSLVDKVAGIKQQDENKTANMTAAGNMPGGGKLSKKMMSKDTTDMKGVDKIYTTPVIGEKGPWESVHKTYTTPTTGELANIDVKKAAELKANPKRPAPLKRTSKIKLSKLEWQTLKDKRAAAAATYAARSQSVKMDMVYGKNAELRKMKRESSLKKKQQRSERVMNNCTIMYSVGPQPKYKMVSQKFREFRAFQKTKLACAKKVQAKGEHVSFMYKVGSPVKVAAK